MSEHYQSPDDDRLAVYLAGPILGVAKDAALGWRLEFKRKYGDVFHVLLPQDVDHQYEELRGDDLYHAVADGERKLILNCNATLAYLPTLSLGTAMGIMYAYQSGRTVVVVSDLPQLSKLIYAHAHQVVGSFDEAAKFIQARHRRSSIHEVRSPDGISGWDPSRITRSIQSAIESMNARASASLNLRRVERFEPPRASKLAAAVVMALEDRSERGEFAHLISSEQISHTIEKVLMDNAHRREVHTLARTYIEQQARKQRRHQLELSHDDRLEEMQRFLHDLKGSVGNIGRVADDLAELIADLQVSSDQRAEFEDLVEAIRQNKHSLQVTLRKELAGARERHRMERIVLKDFLLQQAARTPRVTFDLSGVPAELCIETRPYELERIFGVLIDNSVRYGFKSSPSQHDRIFIQASSSSTWDKGARDVTIDYWNNGAPTTSERARTFFNQTSRTHAESWRVGLAQVRRRVEELGGEISCDTIHDGGAAPGGILRDLSSAEKGPPLFQIVLSDARRPLHRVRKALVADDRELARQDVIRILKKAQFDYEEAATVEDALNAVKRGGFSIAIIDIDFEETRDGLWLLKQIRMIDEEICIVVLSESQGRGRYADWKRQAVQARADGVLEKQTYRREDLLRYLK